MSGKIQSFAAVSSNAGDAAKLYSQAIRDTEADRKAEAKKVRARTLLERQSTIAIITELPPFGLVAFFFHFVLVG